MKNKMHLTRKEFEIMKILWEDDNPKLISEIHTSAKNIADNSLHPMIKKLIEKGFINVTGNVKVVKTSSRLYSAAISIDEYAVMQLEYLFKSSNGMLNVGNAIHKFIRKHRNNEKMMNEFKKYIQENF